jgi:putative ABC transport system permease protein
MYKTYFITAFRHLRKNRLFSFINIVGLAIGLAAAIVISLWVFDELSYDRFHSNSHRIFRIERDLVIEGNQMVVPITSPPTAPQIAADYPDVEAFTRVAREDVLMEDHRQNQNKERILYADSSFFQVFSFPVVAGDPASCLRDPFSVALSETAARKYLGEDSRPGQTIRINVSGQERPFTVTAIYEDFPHNSHLQSDVIASFTSLHSLRHEMMMTSWMASFHFSYILLREDTDPQELEVRLQEVVEKYFGEDIRSLLGIGNPQEFMKILLRPLTDIHLEGERTWELNPPGSKTSVAVFSVVAILLLAIAAINFMNLSTARASRRALEVGVRKASGATRRQLIAQFLGESLIYGLIALVLAIMLVEVALPFFSTLTGKEIRTAMLLSGWNLPIVLAAWLTTALVAGMYPAFFLSSFNTVDVLKGNMGAKGGHLFRKILVTGQFTISIGLIICSTTVYRHLDFMNHKDLGFNRFGLIDIPVEDRSIFGSYETLKHDILSLPTVSDMTRSMVIPTDQRYTDNPHLLRNNPETFFPIINRIDERYLPTFDIKILAGENFLPQMVSDSTFYYIINDAARKMFGFETPFEALGQEVGLLTDTQGGTGNWGQIVGVCEDFHFQPLTEPIKPMVLGASYDGHSHITLRVDQSDLTKVNQQVQEIWDRHFPEHIYDADYVSRAFDRHHLTEKRLQSVLLAFTILSIFVACLGLLGLSAFSVEQRRKEIGIRKTLGAEIHQIILLITSEFSKLVLLANIIAFPLAYLIMNDWLANFPYRRGLEFWVFLAAGFLAWMTAFLTVMIQTYKASKANPVKSLQSE